MILFRLIFLSLVTALWGCTPSYTLVSPGEVPVAKKGMTVQTASAWNRIPKGPGDIAWEESWTKNGPLLDSVAFVGGLPAGKSLVEQHKKADQQVPRFRADMSPDDLVTMIESYYRIGGASTFEITTVEPAQFIGPAAVRFDFTYVPGDKVPRKGRCVLEVVNDRLYMMKLEGAASHYFDAVAREFDLMTGTAKVR
jgi:hypothetical protein